MPDESGGRHWVVEPPPATGEIAMFVAVGDGVELNDEQAAALGALLSSLEAADVAGFTDDVCTSNCGLKCTSLDCGILRCQLNKRTGSGPGWNLMGSFGPRP